MHGLTESDTRRPDVLDRMLEAYENHPVIRVLVRAAIAPAWFGVGNALEEKLSYNLNRLRAGRARDFFDQLASGQLQLTPEVVEQDEFLHAYFSTLKAAMNEGRREKIGLYANLLLHGVQVDQLVDDSLFENLRLLEALSLRQLRVVTILKEHSDRHPVTPGVTGNRLDEYWDAFAADAGLRAGVDDIHLKSTLLQLMALGLFEKYDRSIQGRLTPAVDEFLHWIEVTSLDEAELLRAHP